MDFTFAYEIFQRESLQFLIQSTPPVDYSNKLVNIIIKNTDDTLDNNLNSIINKTLVLDNINLSNEDFTNAQNGIIKINIDSTETNIDSTDYKVMIQITDGTNIASNVLGVGTLKVKDNYLKFGPGGNNEVSTPIIINYNDLLNKPNLSTVATTGSYNDLLNKPSFTQVNSDWNSISGVSQILNKPIIPPGQVNSDWNSTSGVSQILNKPSLSDFLVATDIQAGTNITLAVVGKTVTISSTGGGGGGAPTLDANYNFLVGNAYVTTGVGNIAIGYNCGQTIVDQSGNIAIGFQTLKGYPVNNCTAIGYFSSANLTGSFNSSFGRESLAGTSSGNYNTAVGYAALYNTTYSNCSGLGNFAQVTGDNQIQLGNSSTTTYVFGTVQNRSDLRDKTDIKDCSLGLDFIMSLKPVDYKWNMREDYIEQINEEYEEEELNEKNEKILVKKYRTKLINHENDGSKTRKRNHHGFIAQDFIDRDFGGFQDHSKNGGKEVMTIGYDEFIAPLVKAMQEQQLIIEQLKKDILLLKSSLK